MNGLTGSAKWEEEMSEGFWRNTLVHFSLMTAVLFVFQGGGKKLLGKKIVEEKN